VFGKGARAPSHRRHERAAEIGHSEIQRGTGVSLEL